MFCFFTQSFSLFFLFYESKLRCGYVCRVKANAGALTNFEVLDLLNSRGASKDTTRVIASETVSRSEYKVYDYLMETAASTQTRESVTKFSDKCKGFKLAKAEILNIINLRPSSDVELTPVCVLLFTKSHLSLRLEFDDCCDFL